MKLKEDIFSQLELLGMNHLIMLAPLSPCMITGLKLKGSVHTPEQPADFELGWSGLQFVSSSAEAKSLFIQHNIEPFALEGCGYISLSKELFDSFDLSVVLSDQDKVSVTSFVSRLVGEILHKEAAKSTRIIVVHLGQSLKMQDDVIGFQVHIIVPVDEGVWIGLYQLHTQELQAATSYYQSIKGGEAAANVIADSFSSQRTLF
jgi:hypothetical protein